VFGGGLTKHGHVFPKIRFKIFHPHFRIAIAGAVIKVGVVDDKVWAPRGRRFVNRIRTVKRPAVTKKHLPEIESKRARVGVRVAREEGDGEFEC
jgi:hypothetical protein